MTSLMLRPSWAHRWRKDFSSGSGSFTVVVMEGSQGNKFIITLSIMIVKLSPAA
jgi:hypothetical protein